MQDYDFFAIISPWLALIAILIPLVYAERWVHQHFFGIGYLISKDKMSATRLFYVFFLPGIVIHELVQYLVAGALNVPIKRIIAWPDVQENGILRLDFVVVEQKETDRIRAMIVAAAPFLVMSMIVWYISTRILDLHAITEAFGTGDIRQIWDATTVLFQKSDFIIWLYFLFVVANSMIPKREETRGYPLLIAIFAVLVVFMLIVGMGDVLVDTLTGPVSEGLTLVNTALATILILDIAAILLLGITEDTLEKWRGFRMDYSTGEEITKPASKPRREPGSDEPYPAGEPLPSIYAFDLPLPDPDKLPKARPARPAMPSPERTPALASAGGAPAVGEARSAPGEPSGILAADKRAARSSGVSSLGQRVRETTGASEAPSEGDSPERPPRAERPTFDRGQRPAESSESDAAPVTSSRRSMFGSRPEPDADSQDTKPASSRPSDPAARPALRPPQAGAPTSSRPPESGERPAARSRDDFEAERQKMFGSRPAQPPAQDRPARPASARSGDQPPRSFGRPREEGDQSRETGQFPAQRTPTFSERPARPTGTFTRPDASQLRRPGTAPLPKPGRPAGDDEDESVDGEVEDDVQYEDFDDVDVPEDEDYSQDIDEDE